MGQATRWMGVFTVETEKLRLELWGLTLNTSRFWRPSFELSSASLRNWPALAHTSYIQAHSLLARSGPGSIGAMEYWSDGSRGQ